jgi:hypothetical protein
MIPVAILNGLLAGLAAGRIGWLAVGVVAVAWPVLLIATDIDSGLAFFLSAGVLAAVNTTIGVGVGITGR